jgi:hypothetical protein
MPYQATVIPVMIASPGDVIEERDITRDIIHEWNYVNSLSSGVVLMPVGWDTHSSPELGGRPQGLINERVLKECDLLVGIFWTRLGSPTGKAASGSVEEIERHIEAGKPVMVYFSTAPVAPQNLDQRQFTALTEFKTWCMQRGLVEQFENVIDFRQKFSRHLQIKLMDNPYLRQLVDRNSETATPSPAPQRTHSVSPQSPVNQRSISLSKEAIILLGEAAADKSGTIISARYIGGHTIQTNGKKFGDSSDRRSMARWEHAIEQLANQGLVIRRGNKNEIFEISGTGYQLAEELNSRAPAD